MTAFAQCARHLQNRHPTIPRYGPKNPIYRAAHSFFISPPVMLASIIHTFNYQRDYYIPAAEVAATENARTQQLAAAHV